MSNDRFPVRFHADAPPTMGRIHVVIRLALLVALGALGGSSLYWVLYLGLPAVAALLLVRKGSARYFAEDAPRIVRALEWLAQAYAYLWLLTDAPPVGEGARPVVLDIQLEGRPTAASAMARLLYSVPATFLLVILSFAGGLLWIVGALGILVVGHPPAFVSVFLAATLRYQFRLVAYHLSLVERYPSLEEGTFDALPGPRAA